MDFGTILNDMRFGARALLKQPGSAIISIVVLAMGIGLSTFVFSLVYGVLFRGLDVPQAEQLMVISRSDMEESPDGIYRWPIEDLLEIRKRTKSFEGIAGYWEGTVNVAGTEAPERYDGVFITANLMQVLRVQPTLGRSFRNDENIPGAPPAVILGYQMWQDRFAGDRGVLGTVLRVNGESSTVVGVMPEGFDYPETEDRHAFLSSIQHRLASDPAIRMASLTTTLPGGFSPTIRVRLEGIDYPEQRDRPSVHYAMVGVGFFDVMGVELIEGEDFDLTHTAEVDPVAIVNQSMARNLWSDGSPIGRRFRTGTEDSDPWLRVIGVAPDLEMAGFTPANVTGGQQDGYYRPISQTDPQFVSLIALPNAGAALSLTGTVRKVVRSLDPNLPIYQIRTINELIRRNTWFYTVFGKVFIAFGIAALFMAAVGLYGVLSFSVSRRTQEMGIRMALGAGRRDVLGLIVKQGMKQLGWGLGLGLSMAWLVSNVVAVIMFEVNPRDPMVFGVVVGVIVVVTTVASLVPAHRASSVDPMVALRYE